MEKRDYCHVLTNSLLKARWDRRMLEVPKGFDDVIRTYRPP